MADQNKALCSFDLGLKSGRVDEKSLDIDNISLIKLTKATKNTGRSHINELLKSSESIPKKAKIDANVPTKAKIFIKTLFIIPSSALFSIIHRKARQSRSKGRYLAF